MRNRLANFIPTPPPPLPSADVGSTISPAEELAILQQTMPIATPQASFLERNKRAIFVGSAVLVFGIIGLVLLVQI